jgi:hypothetical protein
VPRLRFSLGLISVWVLGLGVVGARPGAAHAEACEAWPGEPSPLPSVDTEDGVAARWARLRADELAQLAGPLEEVATADAHRLWRHAACLDPRSARARDGSARTAPARIHRPPVQIASRARPAPRADLAAALAVLDEPVRVSSVAVVAPAGVATPPPVGAGPERTAEPTALDSVLAEAEGLLRAARFEESLGRIERARRMLPGDDAAGARRARLEALAATAQVALGRDREARESFGAALRADPSFRLDARSTSPKVMRAFDAARESGGAASGEGLP